MTTTPGQRSEKSVIDSFMKVMLIAEAVVLVTFYCRKEVELLSFGES